MNAVTTEQAASTQANDGTRAAGAFDAALGGMACRLRLDDGRVLSLPVHRWHGEARDADRWLLDRCHGPTIDLGCGPGRLVAALLAKGVTALGVDASKQAGKHCAARGVPAVLGDIFASVPKEGTWRHAILADGNIGIGGDPLALLRRVAGMLGAGGSALVEVDPHRRVLWSGSARLDGGHGREPWFRWAVVGVDALRELAETAGMTVIAEYGGRRRGFLELAAGGGVPR